MELTPGTLTLSKQAHLYNSNYVLEGLFAPNLCF